MKGFHVTVQSLDLDVLLDGIEWKRRENTLIRTVLHSRFGSKKFNGGIDIKRADGVVASLHIFPRQWTCLNMSIWE